MLPSPEKYKIVKIKLMSPEILPLKWNHIKINLSKNQITFYL